MTKVQIINDTGDGAGTKVLVDGKDISAAVGEVVIHPILPGESIVADIRVHVSHLDMEMKAIVTDINTGADEDGEDHY